MFEGLNEWLTEKLFELRTIKAQQAIIRRREQEEKKLVDPAFKAIRESMPSAEEILKMSPDSKLQSGRKGK